MKQNNQSRDKNKRKHKKSKKNTPKIDTNFYGSHLIPITPIINYMKDNFDTYLTHFKQAETEHKNVIYLDDVFETKNIVKPPGKVYNLKTEINSNPNMPLDKLIAYSFYMKTKEAFITKDKNPTTNNTYLDILKYQMGKDISRDDRTIQYYNPNYEKKDADGEIDTKKYTQIPFNASYFSKYGDDDIVTDEFYKLIIKYYSSYVNKKIDYNIINKIALLSCQNIFSLISDLVSAKIDDMLSPNISSVSDSRKNIVITFTKKEQTMEFNFDSNLLITTTNKDGEEDLIFDPRGHLTFNFFVDLNNNNFKFNNFELSYDLGNDSGNDSGNDLGNDGAANPVGNKRNLQYAVPVTVGIGGIVATPFILGALGGKRLGTRTRTRPGKRLGTRPGTGTRVRTKK